MQMPTSSTPQSQNDLETRKALGRARLRENKIEDALRIYASILKDYPQDIDACLFIGDCYLAENDNETALLMYNQALQINPNHPAILSRLRLARETANQSALNLDPGSSNQAQEVAKLLQRLTGRSTPIREEEVERAAQLLEEMIHQPHPARIVAARLNEIDELLPALLEVNIRQARADGRPDIAEALENLRDNIQLQLGVLPAAAQPDLKPAAASAARPAGRLAAPKIEPVPTRVLFLTGKIVNDLSDRPEMMVQAFKKSGFQTTVAEYSPKEKLSDYQCVVFRSPHREPRLLEALAFCSAAKIPTIVDLERDYEQMPVGHPDYDQAGLGTLEKSKAFTTALLLADRISVASPGLAAALKTQKANIQIIPDGWTQQNPLWSKTASPRRTFHIGWVSHSGQVDDVMMIRRVLVRICREFTQARLVIAGDPQVYQLFESMPDTSRLFLPSAAPEDFPYILSQMDVLIVPLRNNAFNRSISDRHLMEAGVRVIPWVASPIPAYAAWKEGGLIANALDEWHSSLRQLAMDSQMRSALGQAGRRKAETREVEQVGQQWGRLIAELLNPVK